MQILKNSIWAILLMVGSLFFVSTTTVQETTTTPSNTDVRVPITSETALELVRSRISELEAQPNLSKKEARKLNRLKKRVTKIEKMEAAKAGDSWLVALLLSFFLGVLGIHRFYLGYMWQGVVQLLTFGGLGIWAFIDFIRIIIRDLQPNGGSYVD